MGRTKESAQVLCDQTGQQVVSLSKVGDHGAHPLAAEQFVAQSEPRVDRDTQHFRCPQDIWVGYLPGSGEDGSAAQDTVPVCLGYDTTGIPDIGKESVEMAEPSPRQRRRAQGRGEASHSEQWEEIVGGRAESRTTWESQTRENFMKMTIR